MKKVYGSWAFYDNLIVQSAKELRLADADSSHYAALKAPSSITTSYTLTLPGDDGAANQVLQTDGSGVLSWATILTTSLASGSLYIGVAGVATAVDTVAQGDIEASSTGLNIKSGVIVNADINASAAIALSKLAAVTANRALASDGSGFITASAVTDTELGYVSGVTSSIQTQFTGKQSTSEKGQANGYAALDGAGKVPVAQLPNSIMEYQGTWNASTNTPTLADGAGSIGDVYRVSVAGTQDLGSGNITFDVGDYAIRNSSLVFEKADTTDAVASVNGATGVVTVNAINELTGDVTTSAASGSQSKATTIANGAVTNAKVASGIDAVKIADGSVDNTEFQYLNGVTSGIQTQLDSKMKRVTADWANADGVSKAVTHNLNTKDILVSVYDKNDDTEIEVDSITRTSVNVVTIVASQAPIGPSGWRIVVIG